MRFGWLSGGSRPLIGVDISSSAVKMLELGEDGKGGYRVERYAIAQLPKDSISDGNIAKPDVVEASMLEAWRSLATRTKEIALALPSSAIISKKVLVPAKASDSDIDAQITAEANAMASFPVDEISLDYQILGPSAKSPSENEAIVVISRSERVEERVAIAEAAGLKTVLMDVDDFASLSAYAQLANQLPGEGKGQTVALIDIGANFTHVNILHNNTPVFQRTQAFGGYILTKEAARRLNISIEEAEEGKRRGQLAEPYQSEVLPTFLDSASQEILRALQLFFSSASYQSVDHILLSGGCAALPGLVDTVRNRTQTHVTIANPFAQMGVSAQVNKQRLTSEAPMLYVACGLALRRFDRT